MKDRELARSACNVFGHRWGEPKYHADYSAGGAAYGNPENYALGVALAGGSKLSITRVKTCARCGKVERLRR